MAVTYAHKAALYHNFYLQCNKEPSQGDFPPRPKLSARKLLVRIYADISIKVLTAVCISFEFLIVFTHKILFHNVVLFQSIRVQKHPRQHHIRTPKAKAALCEHHQVVVVIVLLVGLPQAETWLEQGGRQTTRQP